MALQGRDRRRDDLAQMMGRGTHAAVWIGQVGEEPLGTALHDRQEDPVLGGVVVGGRSKVDRAPALTRSPSSSRFAATARWSAGPKGARTD